MGLSVPATSEVSPLLSRTIHTRVSPGIRRDNPSLRPDRPPNLAPMAFLDETKLYVRGGRGGDGSASMHSEPFKPRGGPDGGNGGRGGSVIMRVSGHARDLSWLADHPHQRAEDGKPGRSSQRDG